MTTTEALEAWGAYDCDDPFPLFAAVRGVGAVHAVTLADGHDAWLVVGYDEARIALNDPRLSKDKELREQLIIESASDALIRLPPSGKRCEDPIPEA